MQIARPLLCVREQHMCLGIIAENRRPPPPFLLLCTFSLNFSLTGVKCGKVGGCNYGLRLRKKALERISTKFLGAVH
jgi:hypothetical protein